MGPADFFRCAAVEIALGWEALRRDARLAAAVDADARLVGAVVGGADLAAPHFVEPHEVA